MSKIGFWVVNDEFDMILVLNTIEWLVINANMELA